MSRVRGKRGAAAWAIMVLIGIGVLLSMELGRQAIKAWRTQERVLEAAMQDYALLAGNRFAQSGVYTLYRKLSVLNPAAYDRAGQGPVGLVAELDDLLNQPDSALFELRPMVKRVFATPADTRRTWWGGQADADIQFIATVESALGPLRDVARPGLFVANGDGRIFYGIPLPGGEGPPGLAGVELDPERVITELWSAASVPLLPGLMDEELSNGSFAIEIRGPSDQVLVSTTASPDARVAADMHYSSLYEGLLPGYTVRLSLSPQAAQQLLSSRPDPGRAWRLVLFIAALLLVLALSVLLVRRQQQLADLRERFVAQVSHELRTPLTQIRMYAETLRLERLKNRDERDHALEVIDREAHRLGNLVDNVLSFSRLQQNTEALHPVDLDLVDAVTVQASQFAALHDGLPVAVHSDEPTAVYARVDPDILQQVVFNLLDNAVKYGGGDVRIRMQILATPQPTLIVEDDGPGIPPDERKKVWREFYRPEREQRNATSGSGIGLALVRGLMAASGGEISLADSSRGARFELRFPGVSRQ